MPRKRKGPKTEPSEASTDAGTFPNPADVPALVMSSNNIHAAATLHNPDTTNKRLRHLTPAEQDRLGSLVSFDQWIQAIQSGRGAAVCICAEVTSIQQDKHAQSCLISISCLNSDHSSSRSLASLLFRGSLAEKLHELLSLIHKLGPPATLYVSGFAANVATTHPNPLVLFQHETVILKMSPQPATDNPLAPVSTIWIEEMNLKPPSAATAANRVTSVPVPPPYPVHVPPTPTIHSALPTIQKTEQTISSDDWFTTPVPEVRHPPVPSVMPITTSITSTSAPVLVPRTNPSVEPESSHNLASAVGRRAIRTVSELNPNKAARNAITLSRSSSTPLRHGQAAPMLRRNAPNVKPRRMANCLYTPISLVRDGEQASIIGAIVAAGDPRRSASGTRDLSIRITVADASCLSGTGYAKELKSSMTIMLFASSFERIPHQVRPGQILAIRSVQIQMFASKPQAVGKSAGSWSWAIYDPVTGDVRASSNFPLVSHSPAECSAEETEHIRDLSNWYSELQAVDANVVTRTSRPMIKLQSVQENLFFDTVVEVLKVYTHTVAPDLYVTDYTNHSLFFRGNDKYLMLTNVIHYPDHSDGWGHVFQISLWDSHATIAEGLQTGDIIRIQNVRAKRNPRGLLTGGLGNSTDSGIKIRTLKPTDEARIDLEKRKADFVQTLFEVEQGQTSEHAEQEGQSHACEPRHDSPHQAKPDAQLGRFASIVADGTAMVNHPESEEAQRLPAVKSESEEVQPSPAVKSELDHDVGPSPLSQQPFPTPAQRHLRRVQATPSRPSSTSFVADRLHWHSPDDEKPTHSAALELTPLIRCNAPASVPLTAMATLQTSSHGPNMYKLKARVIGVQPNRVEHWARMECLACQRFVPVDQRFCTNCGDAEGASLRYCLRFAMLLQETDAEFESRQQADALQNASGGGGAKLTIPVLWGGNSPYALLPGIDPQHLYHGDKASIRWLKKFYNRLLLPHQYNKAAEMVLAVYSLPPRGSGNTARRFAALKKLNVLYDPADLV